MDARFERWAIVLGAGNGTRLSSLTTRGGITVPKQFCTLNGGPSLLQRALRRAERVVGRRRVTVVVASDHRRWWEQDLRGEDDIRLVEQPYNRGTAAGVLLPLAEVCGHDGDATVFILPSDHWVVDEGVLTRELERAAHAVQAEPDTVVLLGIEPDAPEPSYGWILPGRPTEHGALCVEAFVEKPTPPAASALLASGAVWNSFLLVARARTLWALYEQRLPALLHGMREVLDAGSPAADPQARQLYAELPVHDLSRDMLTGAETALRLLRVPVCGWTDLGTPERVTACVQRELTKPAARLFRPQATTRFDLAWTLASDAQLDCIGPAPTAGVPLSGSADAAWPTRSNVLP